MCRSLHIEKTIFLLSQQLAPSPLSGDTVSAEAVLGLELLQRCLRAAAEVAVRTSRAQENP